MSAVLDTLLVVLIIEPLASLISNGLLWRLYFRDKRRSRVLFSWAFASSVINLCAGVIGYLVVRRLIGLPPHPEGPIITSLALIVVFAIPIYFAALVVWPHPPTPRRRNTDL